MFPSASWPRASRTVGFALALAGAAAVGPALHADRVQPPGPPSDDAPELLYANAAPGYLGIDIRDVDASRAQDLKLSEPRGAEIVALDHDAPACKAGLRLHDVITAVDGQPIVDSVQLRLLMRTLPAGKPLTLSVNRGGKALEVHLKLADRQALLEQSWKKHFRVPPPDPAPTIGGFAGERGFFGGSGPAITWPAESLWSAGADVEALTPQLASHFGVKDASGLLVRSVEENSPAAAAGLRAGDVILKANGAPLYTRADWLQTWQANPGKPVQLSILRDRRERALSVTVNPHNNDSLLLPELSREKLLAQIEPSLEELRLPDETLQALAQGSTAAQQASEKALAEVRKQLEAQRPAMEKALEDARRQMQSMSGNAFQKQWEDAGKTLQAPELQKQLEDAQKGLQSGELQKQLDAARRSLQSLDLQKELEDARKQIQSIDRNALQKQLDDARRKMEQRMRESMQSPPSGAYPY